MSKYPSPPSNLPPGSSVWAYLRDSGGPSQDRSIEQQREVLREYCGLHGLILVDVFEDVHKTGTKDDRDQLREIITRVEHGDKPDGLLLWSYARFARNELDSMYYKALLRKRGLVVHSLIDDAPPGKYQHVFETLIDIASADKAEKASSEAKRGLLHIVRQGAMPGTPPTGFMREPISTTSEQGVTRTLHRWVPNPDFILRIQKAFQMRAAKISLVEISKETRLFRSINSYKTFFTNKIYIGVLEYGDQIFENYCEPIVDMETWLTVQEVTKQFADRLHMKSETDHPRRTNSEHLLSGLLRCGRCNSPMWSHITVKKKGNNLEAYRCTRRARRRDCDLPRIPAHVLETAVIEQLRSLFLDDEYYLAIYRAYEQKLNDSFAESHNQKKSLQKELTSLQKQIDNLTDAIALRGHSESLLNRLDQLESQATDIKSRIAQIGAQARANGVISYSAEQIKRAMHLIADKLLYGDLSVRREILRELVKEIIIDRVEDRLRAAITIVVSDFGIDKREANGGNDDMNRRSTSKSSRWPLAKPEDGNNSARSSSMRKSRTPVGAPSFRYTLEFEIKLNKKSRS
jgi:hypothetical protein